MSNDRIAHLEAFISVRAGTILHQLHQAGVINLSASQAYTMQSMIEAGMLAVAAETITTGTAETLAVLDAAAKRHEKATA